MSERRYSTYIIASRSRTLYIGVTGDLRRRVFQHEWKEYEGFSAKYHCDRSGVVRALRREGDFAGDPIKEMEPRQEDRAD
jgi:predicted GIY-YIG superfamily endonuclease